MKTRSLLFIRAARVPEWDDPVAQALLVCSCTVGCDEGARAAVRRSFGFVTVQVQQVQVGLGTVALCGGEGRGVRQRGGDELLQGLAVVVLQAQRRRLR